MHFLNRNEFTNRDFDMASILGKSMIQREGKVSSPSCYVSTSTDAQGSQMMYLSCLF